MKTGTKQPIARNRRLVAGAALGAVLAVALLGASAPPAFAAGYTTFDVVQGGCLDNPTGVDCNNYADKNDVYMNGGPAKASSGLPDGSYYFAVLTPGSQNGGFIDGASGNLSDTTAGGTAGDLGSGDPLSNRTFTISDHEISFYGGTHAIGTSTVKTGGKPLIRLMPYDDTDNPGGVYILAICQVGAVSPAQCKYDAFRIQPPPPPVAHDLIVFKDVTATYQYSWTIGKSVDNGQQKEPSGGSSTFNYTVTVTHDDALDPKNWQVTGTITLTNPNTDFDVTGVTVTDAVDDGGSCSVTDGAGVTVPKGGAPVHLSYQCTYAAAPSAASGTNTVTATWDNDPQGPQPTPGGSAAFSIPFSFPADPMDNCVTVSDPNAPTNPLGTVCAGDPGEVNNSFSFTYAHTFTGDPGGTCTSHPNTATLTTNTSKTTNTASATVTVCVGLDLAVSKTAATAFTRTFHWGIAKAADKTQVNLIHATDSAAFNYTVNVTHDAGTDGNWQVTGMITVVNPNNWEDIVANLTDAVDDGGSCVVTGGTSVTVPRSGSVARGYTCTYGSAPSPPSGTNTATASWNGAGSFTPDGAAKGTASFAFTAPTTIVDGAVAVGDSLFGSLGTVAYIAPSPATFTYSLAFPAPTVPPLCVSYTNTATLVTNVTGTTGSASKTVTVCRVPIASGALTMGFWQNKNGQGIITAGASTSGVCSSGTWLRQFAPYQDLGATATCGAVAAYAYNVIKAANAGGVAMNAMLKAQMLATSLDVYFSDPGLGGNKIVAPAPIGGIAIDLTLICQMIDGTGGIATCSGTFENVSAAFGGATHLTVSQMISYAASQSNVGGSLWYANVKATQQLVKDAFDAVNNRVAFAF